MRRWPSVICFCCSSCSSKLRYRTDRGYADAAELIADFQADVVARVGAGHVDWRMLAFVGGALHESKIPASPELAAASAKHAVDQNEGGALPTDVHAALAGILEACDGDPFMAVGSLIESAHGVPAEARALVAGALALAGGPEARAAAVLFLLDQDSAVRRAVAGALGEVAASVTPTDVRRLIAMRNWRPENERAEVDAVIRKARAAGIDCAHWPAGSIEAIVATAVDGARSQGFLLLSPVGRKKRISSLLTKRDCRRLERRAGIAPPDRGDPGRETIQTSRLLTMARTADSGWCPTLFRSLCEVSLQPSRVSRIPPRGGIAQPKGGVVPDKSHKSTGQMERPLCADCGATMIEAVSIAPFAHQPGLQAFECPKCGHVTSVLKPATPPHGGR